MPDRIRTFRSTAAPSIEDDPKRKEARAFYSSPRWRRTRAWKLGRSPICECPDKCGELANEVHHIIDRLEDPSKAFELDNLQSVTTRCHARITRQRQFEKLGNLKRMA